MAKKHVDSQDFQEFATGVNAMKSLPSTRRYNITICHEKAFVWFRVAKVCTRTILNHFKQHELPLNPIQAFNIYYPIHQYENSFKFAFVRNPWDRLVSCWADKVVKKNYFSLQDNVYGKVIEFEGFVEYISELNLNTCDIHLRLQSHLIDLNHLDYLGRFETFSDDFGVVCDHLSIPFEGLVHKNKSDRTKYTDFYDSRLRSKVEKMYEKDIRMFGYSFE